MSRPTGGTTITECAFQHVPLQSTGFKYAQLDWTVNYRITQAEVVANAWELETSAERGQETVGIGSCQA